MMNKLIPLNTFSCYDFLQSVITPEKYLIWLKKYDINKAPIITTNHLFGFWQYYQSGKKQKIDLFPGLYLNNVVYQNKTLQMTLFPKNFAAYQKLTKISSQVMSDTNNCLMIEKFEETFQNLIIVLPLNEWVDQTSLQSVFQTLKTAKINCFWGLKDYSELTDQNFLKSASKHYLPFRSSYYLNDHVETNENSLSDQQDFLIYFVLKAIKEQKSLATETYNDPEYHLFNQDDFENKCQSVLWKNALIENAQIWLKQFDFELPTNKELNLKKFSNQTSQDSNQALRDLCAQALIEQNLKQPEYYERLIYELKVIKQKRIADYFLIVADYVKFAYQNNILVGPGRGSAAGSLIAYLLKITKIDPLKNRLIFERFLNPERIAIPDIDLDFEDQKRFQVLNYLFTKYGNDYVAQVVTFQTIAFKTALRDIGRVLKINLIEVNRLTKAIPLKFNHNFEAAIAESMILKIAQAKYPQWFILAKKIMGLPRQTGIHAAGIVISQKKLNKLCGVFIDDQAHNILQLEMNELDLFGFVKMDLLGLKNLTIIANVLKIINPNAKVNDYLTNLSTDDKETFKTLQNGETLGIFQLESKGMTDLLVKFKPQNIDDISAVISLYRPGPINNIKNYLKYRNQTITPQILPIFKDILTYTYGIPIYQEQILEMVQKFAKLSYGEAEILRKAISKKNLELIASLKKTFYDRSQIQNFSSKLIDEVWELILKFASYGFNRSHGISYSYLVYWMGYFKTHYYQQFMVYLLNDTLNDQKKTELYLKELNSKNIVLLTPDINYSNEQYQSTIKDQKKAILLPFLLIKQISFGFTNKLLKERNEKGLFKSLFDFVVRMKIHGLNQQVFTNLIYAGALDNFGFNRKTLLENKLLLLQKANAAIVDEKTINLNLLNEYFKNPTLQNVSENRRDHEFNFVQEIAVLGMILNYQLLIKIRQKLFNKHPQLKIINIAQLLQKHANSKYQLFGIIEKSQEIIIKKTQKKMGFIDFIDETGKISLIIWNSQWNLEQFRVGKIMICVVNKQKNLDSEKYGALSYVFDHEMI